MTRQGPFSEVDPDLQPEVDQMGLDDGEDPIEDVVEPQEEPEVMVEADLDEVDQRLEVAMCYRELLRSDLFPEQTPATILVEREVREFVKGRLSSLMGFKQEAPKQEAPVSVAPLAPTPTVDKPKAPQVSRPAPQVTPLRKAKKPHVPVIKRTIDEKTGQPVAQIGHKRYTIAHNDQGKKYVKDVTPTIVNPLAIPMPALEQMEAVTADHASRSVNASTAKDNKLIQAGAALAIVAEEN